MHINIYRLYCKLCDVKIYLEFNIHWRLVFYGNLKMYFITKYNYLHFFFYLYNMHEQSISFFFLIRRSRDLSQYLGINEVRVGDKPFRPSGNTDAGIPSTVTGINLQESRSACAGNSPYLYKNYADTP